MNKFYTSIKESKELVRLGLNPNTADMFYEYIHSYESEVGWEGYNDIPRAEPYNTYTRKENEWNEPKEDFPCWSVSALIELMPKTIEGGYLEIDRDEEYSILYRNFASDIARVIVFENALFEAAYQMMIVLLEEHYIDSDKLVKNS